MQKGLIYYNKREEENIWVLDGVRKDPYPATRKSGFVDTVIGAADYLGFNVTLYEDDADGILEAVAYLPQKAFSEKETARFAALIVLSDEITLAQPELPCSDRAIKLILRFDPSKK